MKAIKPERKMGTYTIMAGGYNVMVDWCMFTHGRLYLVSFKVHGEGNVYPSSIFLHNGFK